MDQTLKDVAKPVTARAAVYELYDEEYFEKHCGPIPYKWGEPHWVKFFGKIADEITRSLKPRTVLDVGCAVGFLVEALSKRGVETYGIDISTYVISQVPEALKPFCRVCSAAESLPEDVPKSYDLITCIEVLEHMPENDAKAAIKKMAASTGRVLFSSTPSDLDKPSHVDVHPVTYWLALFAEVGFFPDLNFDSSFVSPQAVLFRKDAPKLDDILSFFALSVDRKFHLSAQQAEITRLAQTKKELKLRLEWELNTCNARIEDLEEEIIRLNEVSHDLFHALERKKAELFENERIYSRLETTPNGFLWDLLCVSRRTKSYFLPQGTTRRALYDSGLKGVKSFLRVHHRPDDEYAVWLEQNKLKARDLQKLGAEVERFTYKPLISVITPVFNVDAVWLHKAIDSVIKQVYPYWELCLVDDGSTAAHVPPILKEYAKKDRRIQVAFLDENSGIATATNQGLAMGTGEFVGLLDHDDELAPEALFEVVKKLNLTPGLDLIYSDEDKIDAEGNRSGPFFKPDWSPDLLLSMNYVCHFSVFRKNLLDEIGGFRVGYEGSQDYDVLLRFTERTSRIGHIPKVLYHWRVTPTSAAGSADAKPRAYEAGLKALEQAVTRRRVAGQVEMFSPGRYRVRYKHHETPLVSIIIPIRDKVDLLKRCLSSIKKKTVYQNYELMIVDNDSSEETTLRYLREIADVPVLPYRQPFNWAAINNFAARQTKGDYLLFLNNDTAVIEPDWLGAMLEHAQRDEVGIVGAKLLYPHDRIQHAGAVIGIGGVCGHAFKGLARDAPSYFDFANVIRNYSAVTGACMMVRRQVFDKVAGFDERLKVVFSDIDFCLRVREIGCLVVYTPYAVLYHYESASRGTLHPLEDEQLTRDRWRKSIITGDPYYNPNLTLVYEDFRLRI